jgi:hypothetical protein
MGDRGNIKIGGVYLYTHWAGSEISQILRDALKRGRSRWTDESYLARIIFCEMIKHDVMGTTGYGISTEIIDNEHDILEVNCDKQTVNGISFKEFIGDEV